MATQNALDGVALGWMVLNDEHNALRVNAHRFHVHT
jgi:hypothetical protein